VELKRFVAQLTRAVKGRVTDGNHDAVIFRRLGPDMMTKPGAPRGFMMRQMVMPAVMSQKTIHHVRRRGCDPPVDVDLIDLHVRQCHVFPVFDLVHLGDLVTPRLQLRNRPGRNIEILALMQDKKRLIAARICNAANDISQLAAGRFFASWMRFDFDIAMVRPPYC
jgi:hypothetical protein